MLSWGAVKRPVDSIADLERARDLLDAEWRAELTAEQPDWTLLVRLHFSLAWLERRLRLRRRRR